MIRILEGPSGVRENNFWVNPVYSIATDSKATPRNVINKAGEKAGACQK
jgi:hypothetical protein